MKLINKHFYLFIYLFMEGIGNPVEWGQMKDLGK